MLTITKIRLQTVIEYPELEGTHKDHHSGLPKNKGVCEGIAASYTAAAWVPRPPPWAPACPGFSVRAWSRRHRTTKSSFAPLLGLFL